MTTLLHISASPRAECSASRRVGGRTVAALRSTTPGLRVVERDIGRSTIPHLDGEFARASLMPAAERGPLEHRALLTSEVLIGELESADLLLISTPMHNFTVPSTLKAWLDQVMRPGRTFRVEPSGKVGLLADRPTFAIVACGGRFGEESGSQCDFLGPYLRYALATMGITSVEMLRLAELHRGPESAASASEYADRWISQQLGLPVGHAED